MKVFVKSLLILSVAIIVGAAITYAVTETLTDVEKVQVRLAHSSEEVKMFERIQPDLEKKFAHYKGLKLYDISIEEILQIVSSDLRIETASVRRTFPNQINVEIVPRKPLALLLDVKGQLHPLSSDASLLPSMSVTTSPDLPLLRGLKFFESKEDRKKIVDVLNQIPEKGELSQSNISEIRMNKEKEITLFLVGSGQRVLVGQNLDQGQVDRIEQVLKYLKSRSIKGRVIDARFSKKVVVRVRNAS